MSLADGIGLACVLVVVGLIAFGVYCACDWSSASGILQQATVMDKVYTPESTHLVPQTMHIGDTTYTYYVSETDPPKWELGLMVGEHARWCRVGESIFDDTRVDDLVVVKVWTGGWSGRVVSTEYVRHGKLEAEDGQIH